MTRIRHTLACQFRPIESPATDSAQAVERHANPNRPERFEDTYKDPS
jgi:hypothetical protein